MRLDKNPSQIVAEYFTSKFFFFCLKTLKLEIEEIDTLGVMFDIFTVLKEIIGLILPVLA